MHDRTIPILLKDITVFSIEVQLIHPKGNQKVLQLPLLLIGILIFHPQLSHHSAAAGIVDVMSRRDIGKPILFYLRYDGFPGFP